MSRRLATIGLCLTVFVCGSAATSIPRSKPSASTAPAAVINEYRAAVRALRRIDSDVQIGVSFSDYHSRLLDVAGDTKAAISSILASFAPKEQVPGPLLEVSGAESSYEGADELWSFYFRMRAASDYQLPEDDIAVDNLDLDLLRTTMNDSPAQKMEYDCLSQLPTFAIGGQDYVRLNRALSCYWNTATTLLTRAEGKIAILKPSR